MSSYNSLLNTAETALRNYGKSGDGSLECIGIDLNINGVISEKVYRYCRSTNDDIIDWREQLDPSLAWTIEQFEERGIIKFLEVSKVQGGMGNQYKLYFSVKCNIPFEQHESETELFFKAFGYSGENLIKDAERCVSAHLSPGRSPILMLGVDLCGDSISGIKAHLSLERFAEYSQRIGEKLFFEEIEDAISDVIQKIDSSDNGGECLRIGKVSTACLFYPFMIGINQYHKQTEFKLYFRIKYSGLNDEQILENTINMIRNMDRYVDSKQLEQTAIEMYKIGLFMEGFAIACKDGDVPTIKTYFFPVPKGKIKA